MTAEETERGRSLLDILDELTHIVEHAKSLPMSASVMVNRSEMLDLLETARSIVPTEIVEADSVLSDAATVSDQARADAEGIIRVANEQADGIIAQAKEQANRLVAQDSITIAAKSQATRIIDEAKAEADKLVVGANEYSDDVLAELANQLEVLQDQIHAGRKVLADRMSQED